MLVLLGHGTLFIAVRCRCSVHLALAHTSVGTVPVSLADGSEVAALSAYRNSKAVPRETWMNLGAGGAETG